MLNQMIRIADYCVDTPAPLAGIFTTVENGNGVIGLSELLDHTATDEAAAAYEQNSH
jgi:hypothetical protein